jgi:hypothetical protein
MYPATLFLHSWLRWAILALALVVLVRAVRGAATRAPYADTDRALLRLFAFALTAQFVLGLLLYATSPLVRQLMADMATTVRDRTSRLIAVEHVFVMTVAVALAHLGVVLVKRGGIVWGWRWYR